MAASCHRCLRSASHTVSLVSSSLRQVLGEATSSSVARSFSTSAPASAAAAKVATKKGQTKKKVVLRKNAPASGPRSAATKKKSDSVTQAASGLSKTSPFYHDPAPPPSLDTFDAGCLANLNTGKLFKLSDETTTALSTSSLFALRGKQSTDFLKRPIILRKHHVQLGNFIAAAVRGEPTSSRPLLLTGATGSGKSVTLAIAAAYARDAGAILLYVPQSLAMINSSTSYVYSNTAQAYLQPQLTSDFLKDLLSQNRTALGKLTPRVKADGASGASSSTPSTLEAIIKRAQAPNASPWTKHEALETCILTLAEQTEYPVIVVIDEAEALFSPSQYRDADFRFLQSYELALPRTLLSMLLGAAKHTESELATRPFGLRRGAIICATTASQSQFISTTKILTEPTSLHQVGPSGRPIDLPRKHIQHLHACEFQRLKCDEPITLSEAAQLCIGPQALPSSSAPLDDEALLSKVIESGGNTLRLLNSLKQTLM
ncbi:hypothetical protein K437DRAFT_268747 [Tilletiaria anomala UBC 951]|uniref:Small ribosomal subunit protein mS29 n=1 Tax=Tilletiaria anomala (strain ATCC 24038 / CBS 436.72 / UBC 951) TaxID=1037660 RepID=A0A066VWB0_TILAU|nr:uncharacterized protein K437DRAFT_268747 [Tilletiaria anomala UBC 951]KDN44578.1 hypothetical protein K437DRAFT_268747 [Tilletiaria anomala UBC 951]